MTTTSASAASSVGSKPAWSRSPAIRSESWTFIWQPNVSMRYLRATHFCLCVLRALCILHRLLTTFAFRPFAFAPRDVGAFGALLQHLTRRPPKAIGDRFPAEHARQLVDPAPPVEAADGGMCASAIDPLLDLEMRVGVGGNLRQVRDAQHLKR